MNNLFEEKRTLFMLLLSLIFLGLLAVYLLLLQPLSESLRTTKNANNSLESDIALLEAKKNPESQKTDITDLLLQKKVPLTPELEKLLLTFQAIEQTSGSRIKQVDFEYDGSEPDFDFVREEDQQNNTAPEQSDTQNPDTSAEPAPAEKKGESENENNEKDMERPEKLHLVTAKLTVLSPDQKHFIQFLQEIEKLERVTRVDQLQVDTPTEELLEFQEKPEETLTFTVDVTTFYYET